MVSSSNPASFNSLSFAPTWASISVILSWYWAQSLAHLRMIGVIGGDTHFGRIVDLRVRAFADSAFVTGREVEDSEERLILVGAVSPMPFPSTFIPYLTFLAEVVIFFGVVRAVVAELTQVRGIHLVIGWQAGHAAHVLGTG